MDGGGGGGHNIYIFQFWKYQFFVGLLQICMIFNSYNRKLNQFRSNIYNLKYKKMNEKYFLVNLDVSVKTFVIYLYIYLSTI